jgi:iron complex transport system substrate-binding protein
MNRFYALALSIAFGALSGCPGAPDSPEFEQDLAPDKSHSETLVSLAPSVTETLFALGLGDRIVGVTQSCDFPTEAQGIAKVGGFMDVHFEAILASEAGVVVGAEGAFAERDQERLRDAGKRILLVRDQTVDDVLEGVRHIARELGVEKRGEDLAQTLAEDLLPVPLRSGPASMPRVLLVLSRTPLVVAGPKTFVGELLNRAGCKNAVERTENPYPTWSKEALIASAPEWIVESTMEHIGVSAHVYWKSFQSLPAVQKGQVRSVNANVLLRPGPRMGEGVKALRAALSSRQPKEVIP